QTFTASLTLRNTLHYALRINDAQGRTLKRYPDDASNSATFAFISLPDQPPTVPQVTQPGRDSDAKPGATIQFAATTTDDLGLTRVVLQISHLKSTTPKNAPDSWTTAQEWTFDKSPDNKPLRTASVH